MYERGTGDVPDRVLGFTPSRKGRTIKVPDQAIWYVRPVGALSGTTLQKLAREVKRHQIPGIDLSDHWELTDESLGPFQGLSNVRMLDVSRTRITDKGMEIVAKMRGLALVAVPSTVTDKGFASLASLPRLSDVMADSTRLTDAGLQTLSAAKTLQRLDISGTMVSDAGIAALVPLPKLDHLILNGRITDAGVRTLARVRSLRDLDLSQTQVSDQGLEPLADLPRLETVFLPKRIGNRGLMAISKSRSIRNLDLTGAAAVGDDGVEALQHLKTLQELGLSGTSITNRSLIALGKLPALRMIDLSETKVTSAGLEPLAHVKPLEMLALSWSTLTPGDLRGMAKVRQLKTIILNGVPLPETTMAELRRLDRANPWEPVSGIARAQLAKPQAQTPAAIAASVPRRVAAANRLPMPEAPPPMPAKLTPTTPKVASLPSSGPSAWIPSPTSPKKSLPTPTVRGLGPDIPPSVQVPEKLDQRKVIKGPAPEAPVPALREAKTAPPSVRTADIKPREIPTEPATVPSKATGPAARENALLQSIVRQSHPSRGGGFTGLAGMRQARVAEVAGLSDVSAGSDAQIKMHEDKPENYLGDLEVGVGRSKR